MASVKTLVKDIQDRISSGKAFDPEGVKAFGVMLSQKLASRLEERQHGNHLRLSNLGTPCERKLWYSVHTPELGEPLSASARIKFLLGDIIEEVMLFLARASGHKVEGEQDEVNISGVAGHLDSIIDGTVVDVKSASSYSFAKFRDGELKNNDPFGYMVQLGSYLSASSKDARVTNKDEAAFLVVDKTLGHLTLDVHEKTDVDYDKMVVDKRKMLAFPQPPMRGYTDVPDGKSGNRKLRMECSYCAFKSTCWNGLRTYNYSRGPVFLTHVAREPEVPEVK